MNNKEETLQEKKLRLLKEFEDFLSEKAKNNDDDHFIIDNTVPKNCLLLTNHETGEQLLLKTKIENNELIFTKITIPRKKKPKKELL